MLPIIRVDNVKCVYAKQCSMPCALAGKGDTWPILLPVKGNSDSEIVVNCMNMRKEINYDTSIPTL